jgi:hypothetical protein
MMQSSPDRTFSALARQEAYSAECEDFHFPNFVQDIGKRILRSDAGAKK